MGPAYGFPGVVGMGITQGPETDERLLFDGVQRLPSSRLPRAIRAGAGRGRRCKQPAGSIGFAACLERPQFRARSEQMPNEAV